ACGYNVRAKHSQAVAGLACNSVSHRRVLSVYHRDIYRVFLLYREYLLGKKIAPCRIHYITDKQQYHFFTASLFIAFDAGSIRIPVAPAVYTRTPHGSEQPVGKALVLILALPEKFLHFFSLCDTVSRANRLYHLYIIPPYGALYSAFGGKY